MTSSKRFVVIGCGAAKVDVDEPVPAKDLYTSTYFAKKRAYAETADQWRILSAEHGLIKPDAEIEPYDTTIGDLDDQELEGWADLVVTDLEEWTSFELTNGADEISVELLAGRDYLEPIRPTLSVVADHRLEFCYPFDETSGIGEQMGWLSEQIDQDSPTIMTDGGSVHSLSGTKQIYNAGRKAGFEPASHYVIRGGSAALELDDIHGWIRHRNSRAIWYSLTENRKSPIKRCVLPYFSSLSDCTLQPATDREQSAESARNEGGDTPDDE